MIRTRPVIVFTALLSLLLPAAPAAAGDRSPWLPHEGEFILGGSYTFQSFDRYWRGHNRDGSGFKPVRQHTLLAGFEYGLLDELALDLTIGYTRTDSDSSAGDSDGLDDTTFGARWRLIDEFEHEEFYVPTLTLRLGGIIEGTYEEGGFEAAGDGASGFEGALLFGRTFGDSGFGIYGDLGYRFRSEEVPDDFFASLGVQKTFLDAITVSAGVRHVQGLSGFDIDSSRFTPERLQETREIATAIEGGVGYTDPAGRSIALHLARTVIGRNTPEKFVVGLSIELPF